MRRNAVERRHIARVFPMPEKVDNNLRENPDWRDPTRKKNAKKGARSDENGRPEGCAGGGPRLKTTKRRRHQPRT